MRISGKNQGVRLSTDNKHRIILTGASGNVGSRVAMLVIPSPKGSVILTGRDRTMFRELLKVGAEICIGSMEDSHFLSHLFRNAEAALIMVPFPRHIKEFNVFQRRVVESLFDSIKGSSLKYIIHVSCIGAHRPDKTGPILGNYDLERRLNWLKDINIVHLRPSFFMEGLFDFLSFDREILKKINHMDGKVKSLIEDSIILFNDALDLWDMDFSRNGNCRSRLGNTYL